MPSSEFVPQSLVIRFELEPHSKDGERPVVHPSEEIIIVESGELEVLIGAEKIHPVSYTHLDVYKRQALRYRFKPLEFHCFPPRSAGYAPRRLYSGQRKIPDENKI